MAAILDYGDYYIAHSTIEEYPEFLENLFTERAYQIQKIYNDDFVQAANHSDIDDYYTHIYVFDKLKNKVAAAYRAVITQEALADLKLNMLYTHNHYRYRESFYNLPIKTVELGGMFIGEEYRKNYNTFKLLWASVFLYLINHPGCTHLMGTVCITEKINDNNIAIIQEYFNSLSADYPLVKYISPKAPLQYSLDNKYKDLNINSIKDLDKYLKCYSHPSGLPVLFKKYSILNGAFWGANMNSEIQSVDMFLSVDIAKMPFKFFSRLIGKQLTQKMFDSCGPAFCIVPPIVKTVSPAFNYL
jgi:Acetyltransferase (GNAT) domain